MDKYKILDTSDHSIFSKPMELYEDLYEDKVADTRFNLYKCIDLEMKNQEIFCISDIHADVHRFWQFLYLNKMVLEEKMPDIKDIKWNPLMTNKALVICGDIIDGRRPPNENLHSSENNEILMHTLIYNLRLDAVQYNSYIFCTLGNHDFFAIHNGSRTIPHLYIQYIDGKSQKNYIERFVRSFHNLYETPNHPIKKVTSNDAVYFSRSFVLSRFYLIGFQFFLKINQTLFAHAGFHKSENVIALFENGQNSNHQVQPLFIHRKILEQLSSIEALTGFIEFNKRRNIVSTYANHYDNIFEMCIEQLHQTKFDKALIDKYASYFTDIEEDSVVNNFFLTRRLQKNCGEVDEILGTYGCKMLVLGHCPTCLGSIVFSDANVSDIDDCKNTRIVFSCNSKLLTVDIAFSSGFTPMKYFLECLCIQSVQTPDNGPTLFMKVIRHYLIRNETIEYNHRVYDKESQSWLEYRPAGNSNSNSSNSSNSNSNDEYVLPSRPSLMDIFAKQPKNI